MTRTARLLDVYKATDGWRWRLISSGHIVADSGQAYTRRIDCTKAARGIFRDGRPIRLRVFTDDGFTDELLP